jgi:hypothetical protein
MPMRELETEGSGKDRKDCMRQFRAARDRLSADPARLAEFVEMKLRRSGFALLQILFRTAQLHRDSGE